MKTKYELNRVMIFSLLLAFAYFCTYTPAVFAATSDIAALQQTAAKTVNELTAAKENLREWEGKFNNAKGIRVQKEKTWKECTRIYESAKSSDREVTGEYQRCYRAGNKNCAILAEKAKKATELVQMTWKKYEKASDEYHAALNEEKRTEMWLESAKNRLKHARIEAKQAVQNIANLAAAKRAAAEQASAKVATIQTQLANISRVTATKQAAAKQASAKVAPLQTQLTNISRVTAAKQAAARQASARVQAARAQVASAGNTAAKQAANAKLAAAQQDADQKWAAAKQASAKKISLMKKLAAAKQDARSKWNEAKQASAEKISMMKKLAAAKQDARGKWNEAKQAALAKQAAAARLYR